MLFRNHLYRWPAQLDPGIVRGRFGGGRTYATACLWLFLRMGALEVYGINLRLHTRGSGRSASFASLFIVILHHKRVI